jgi:hypothetical protein
VTELVVGFICIATAVITWYGMFWYWGLLAGGPSKVRFPAKELAGVISSHPRSTFSNPVVAEKVGDKYLCFRADSPTSVSVTVSDVKSAESFEILFHLTMSWFLYPTTGGWSRDVPEETKKVVVATAWKVIEDAKEARRKAVTFNS